MDDLPDPHELLAEVEAERQLPGQRARSPMRKWLEAAYPELIQQRYPYWLGIAKKLKARGVKDANGAAPTPASLASAWRRVRLERSGQAEEQRQRLRGHPRLLRPSVPAREPEPAGPFQIKTTRAKDGPADKRH